MGMPSKLKNFNLFNDGISYLGQVPELTLPKLSRKMEDYVAGGMTGPIEVDYVNEKIELDWTAGGLLVDALQQYGAITHNAVQLRFAGAYQRDDSGEVDAVEIVVRGRHKEIEMGNAKMGDKSDHKYKTTCSYYKLTVNGEDIIELDFINGVEVVGGVDRTEEIRRAIGV
ncbi:phage major tail tube protein [Undibacterium luofuense]|uniref:Phage major tail tube protein n=1 Tax=Undibacterium luofuense TaxID=2828733 RepID=A0A941DKX3_9BURK|nr:phage major tail tube protein [Undibacterium luofuense]MBR7782688.1 phage major tail tube protein [Undibacterium luofuense]